MRLIRALQAPVPWAEDEADAVGRAGEAAVVAALQAALDDRYAAIGRLRLPGSSADLDLVVLAARAIVLEVKTYRGPRRFRCEGRHWFYADAAGSWRQLDAAPGVQAAYGARRVRRRLGDGGLELPVGDAVVWSGDAPLELARPRQPVLRLPALGGWLSDQEPLAPKRLERALRLLLA